MGSQRRSNRLHVSSPAHVRMYARLQAWGYEQKRVNQGQGEYARDEEGTACVQSI
jgi:hypothetical protein